MPAINIWNTSGNSFLAKWIKFDEELWLFHKIKWKPIVWMGELNWSNLEILAQAAMSFD